MKHAQSVSFIKQMRSTSLRAWGYLRLRLQRHWLSLVVLLVAVLLFFAPLLPRLGNYAQAGDALFNAWTITRVQQCILGQNCRSLTDGNIFYGHEHTLAWSEAQISTAVLFMPLRLVTDNPVLINNIATITMTVLVALSMYLLALYLSGGHRLLAVVCGLIFALAPFRISAVWHLQNLSIFAMPLAVLVILKLRHATARAQKWWLFGLFMVLLYQFYASWYQMAFTLLAVVVLVLGLWAARQLKLRKVLAIAGVVGLAFVAVLPLARVYVQSSQQNQSGYNLTEKTLYSASLSDYIIPSSNTFSGKVFYKLTGISPSEQVHNGYNPDSQSYHGLVLYTACLVVIWRFWRHPTKGKAAAKNQLASHKALALVFTIMAGVGVVVSLGPFLKIHETFMYVLQSAGLSYTIPLPYLLIEILAPQLSFIRAIGRASVVTLMSLCAILALAPHVFQGLTAKRTRWLLLAGLCGLVLVDIMPLRTISITKNVTDSTYYTPAVYSYIKQQPQVDKLVIIASRDTTPGESQLVRQQMMWAGYHGKYLYNGHSAFVPRDYEATMRGFYDLSQDDLEAMRRRSLQYVLVDKRHSTPATNQRAMQLPAVYDDADYRLIKL